MTMMNRNAAAEKMMMEHERNDVKSCLSTVLVQMDLEDVHEHSPEVL